MTIKITDARNSATTIIKAVTEGIITVRVIIEIIIKAATIVIADAAVITTKEPSKAVITEIIISKTNARREITDLTTDVRVVTGRKLQNSF